MVDARVSRTYSIAVEDGTKDRSTLVVKECGGLTTFNLYRTGMSDEPMERVWVGYDEIPTLLEILQEVHERWMQGKVGAKRTGEDAAER